MLLFSLLIIFGEEIVYSLSALCCYVLRLKLLESPLLGSLLSQRLAIKVIDHECHLSKILLTSGLILHLSIVFTLRGSLRNAKLLDHIIDLRR